MDIKNEIIKIRKLPEHFFEPSIRDVNDISELKNIDEAKELLIDTINSNKMITIFSDIDIDGVMATTIMYNWLDGIYHDNKKIIYEQRNKGHGVKRTAIKTPTDLLIIVDSSSNEIDEVKEILNSGLAKNVLIIDHHEVDGTIIKGGADNQVIGFEPNVLFDNKVILLNPHQLDCKFKNKDVSGAMLVYRFLEYVSSGDDRWEDKILRLSDLCAISIISDVMRVDNMENRYYYYRGMNSIQNQGLFNFMNTNRINTFNVSSNKLAFEINPKLNATIRMQNIRALFELFLQTDKLQNDRREIVKSINEYYKLKAEIEDKIQDKITILFEGDTIILLQNNYADERNISSNFNGVLASQIANKKNKHTLIVNDRLRGSGRSLGNYFLKDYIDSSGSASGAGHQQAFGIKINDLNNLISYFETHPPTIDLVLPTDYEVELGFNKLSKNIFESIESLQYMTGNGFDNIKVKINNAVINDIKETSGGNIYYVDNRKSYIRIMNKTNLEFDELDNVNLYGSLFIKEYFGREYFEIHCDNIELN